jgi:hypothetical protein
MSVDGLETIGRGQAPHSALTACASKAFGGVRR